MNQNPTYNRVRKAPRVAAAAASSGAAAGRLEGSAEGSGGEGTSEGTSVVMGGMGGWAAFPEAVGARAEVSEAKEETEGGPGAVGRDWCSTGPPTD